MPELPPLVPPASNGAARPSNAMDSGSTQMRALRATARLSNKGSLTSGMQDANPTTTDLLTKALLDPSRVPSGPPEVAAAMSKFEPWPGRAKLKKGWPDARGPAFAMLTGGCDEVSENELVSVRSHRWSFNGAEAMAQRGKAFCFFVNCLLELQQNVQMNEEEHALTPAVTKSCKMFIEAQCVEGRKGEMYQVLNHFICNSKVFDEWESYLNTALESPQASDEEWLIPYLEQVWIRFEKFQKAIEEIFGSLDTQFIWRHRLPKVGELLRNHMKRRVFSSERVLRNEIFKSEKSSDGTVKQIKRAFGLYG